MGALGTLIPPQPVLLVIPPPSWGLEVPDQGPYLTGGPPGARTGGILFTPHVPAPPEKVRLRGGMRGSSCCVRLSATRGRPSLQSVCCPLGVRSLRRRVGLRTAPNPGVNPEVSRKSLLPLQSARAGDQDTGLCLA